MTSSPLAGEGWGEGWGEGDALLDLTLKAQGAKQCVLKCDCST